MVDAALVFTDRRDAGRKLAAELVNKNYVSPVVYALPRGGVPVAAEVAEALGAPLDLILVRKIGAPSNPEVALAAIVEGDPPQMVVNDEVMRRSGASEAYLNQTRDRELAEMQRRRAAYLGDRSRISPAGHTAVVVDDGLATGATMKAAIIALRRLGADQIVAAIPIAPASEVQALSEIADEVVCLIAAEHFRGVGGAFRDFHQLSDEETVGYLRRAWSVVDGSVKSGGAGVGDFNFRTFRTRDFSLSSCHRRGAE